MTIPAGRRDRWFGSIRILQDGRVRFSPWTYPGLPFAFWVTDTRISVMWGGLQVLYLWLERKRVDTACFVYTLAPDLLREAVRDLRRVRGGLERWIVPALEFTAAGGTLKRVNPGLYAIIPEVLASCRDLPVADHWNRIRAHVLANAAAAEAEAEAAPRSAAKKERAARAPRGKARRSNR